MSKVRVNVTVDSELLKKARRKLGMFGGKLSTLFNAFLDDFVKSAGKTPTGEHDEVIERLKELEKRVGNLEKKI